MCQISESDETVAFLRVMNVMSTNTKHKFELFVFFIFWEAQQGIQARQRDLLQRWGTLRQLWGDSGHAHSRVEMAPAEPDSETRCTLIAMEKAFP
jgi:hypothetical protein